MTAKKAMLTQTSTLIDRVRAALEHVAEKSASLSPLQWATSNISFDLDPWQEEFLDSEHRRELILASRQTGKSTTVAAKAAAMAATKPSSRIIIIAPSHRQSLLLLNRVRDFTHGLISHDTVSRIELVNKSEVIALPGDRPDVCRGYDAVNLLLIDESAFVRDSVLKVTIPMTAVVDGSVIMISTPSAPTGAFHKAWTDLSQDWHRVRITADLCPRYDEKKLADIRARIGETAYRSEYLLEFIASGEAYFSQNLIDRLFDEEPTPANDWISAL